MQQIDRKIQLEALSGSQMRSICQCTDDERSISSSSPLLYSFFARVSALVAFALPEVLISDMGRECLTAGPGMASRGGALALLMPMTKSILILRIFPKGILKT